MSHIDQPEHRNSYRARVRHQGSQRTALTFLFHFVFFSIIDTDSDSISFLKTPTHFLFPFPVPSTSRCKRKEIQSPDSPDSREMGQRITGDKEGSRVDLVVMPAVAVRFICAEGQYVRDEEGCRSQARCLVVSTASTRSTPEKRRECAPSSLRHSFRLHRGEVRHR
ncbi:hypothetical protein PVAP13_3KG516002 [Panicum virgatum]|uniref:Uncharacterized protein n=1 Tax=Panicum virgatum TaxID=38727 RepID=A0A8T0VB26_PANVG|nr:hypothetical protein PVAP13_3KG516002 [Panicum virgatum]